MAAGCLVGSRSLQAQEQVTIELEEIGFGGAFKVGSWVPVRLRLRAAERRVDGTLHVEVPDSDGVVTEIEAADPVAIDAGQTAELTTYVKPGKLYGDLLVTVSSGEGALGRRLFRPSQQGEGDFTRGLVQSRLLIALLRSAETPSDGAEGARDDSTGLEDIGSLESGSGNRPVTVVLREAGQLPARSIGYDSLDALLLALGDVGVDGIDAERREALEQWVKTGGTLVVSLGSDEANRRAALFGQLLAGAVEGMAQTGQLRGLEAYCGTGQPIQFEGQIPLSRLARESASVLASQGNLPLVARKPYGFGAVVVLAFDVTRPPFSRWASRGDFWRRLFHLSAREEPRLDGGRLTQIRITDLASQFYAVLGKFEALSLVPFGVVALLVVAYLALVGPGDFFLVRRLIRRVELTWLTCSLLILGVSGAGVFAAGWLKGDRLRGNQIDLIDVDVSSGWLRGTSWLTLFSPRTDSFNLSLVPRRLGRGAAQSGAPEVLLSWLGVPEDTLGGMYKETGLRVLTRAYRYGRGGASLEDVPVETWSTKSFMGHWVQSIEPPIDNELTSLSQSDLRGSFTLRLDAPLASGLLAYGDRAYSLETIRPDEPVRFTGQHPFRSLNGLLTNKTLIGREIRSQSYDLASYEWDPLVRMMLFHEAAGGRSYTELDHAYLGFTDLSGHLELGRALLVGTMTGSPGNRLLRDGEPLDAQADLKQRTYVRFVLPVERHEAE
jgi:hypothetical protein